MKVNFENLPISSFFKNMASSFRSMSEPARVATIMAGITLSFIPISRYLNMATQERIENAKNATLNLDEFEKELLKEAGAIKKSIKKIESENIKISDISFKKNVDKILSFFDKLPEQIQVNNISQKSLLRIKIIRLHLDQFDQTEKQAITDTLNNSFMELVVNYSKNHNPDFIDAVSLDGFKSQNVISEPMSPLSTLSPVKITKDLIAGAGHLRDRIFGSNKNPKFFKPQFSEGHDQPFLRIARLNFPKTADSKRTEYLRTENKEQYYGLINYANWFLNSHEEQAIVNILSNNETKIKRTDFQEIYHKLRLLMPNERMIGSVNKPNIQDLFMVFNNIGHLTDGLHILENELINDPESPSASESEIRSDDTIESMSSSNSIKFIKHAIRWLKKNYATAEIDNEEFLDDVDVKISSPNTTKSVEASQYLAQGLTEMFNANETHSQKFTAYLTMYCKNIIYLTKTLQDRLYNSGSSISINDQDAEIIKSSFESCKNYFRTRYYIGEERALKFINRQMFSPEMSQALENAYGNFDKSEDYSLDMTLVTPPKAKKKLFVEQLEEQKNQTPTTQNCAIQ